MTMTTKIREIDPSSDVLDSRQRLALCHRGYIKAQLDSGLLVHVRDLVSPNISRPGLVSVLAMIRCRCVMEMAVAHALGDAVSRLDHHVDSQIASIFGNDVVREVLTRCHDLGCVWGVTTPWPSATPAPTARPSALSRFAFAFARFFRGFR